MKNVPYPRKKVCLNSSEYEEYHGYLALMRKASSVREVKLYRTMARRILEDAYSKQQNMKNR